MKGSQRIFLLERLKPTHNGHKSFSWPFYSVIAEKAHVDLIALTMFPNNPRQLDVFQSGHFDFI